MVLYRACGETRRYVGVLKHVSKDELSVVPRLQEGIDLVKTGLSAEEGFVASRIDGRSNIREIAAMVGKPTAHTLRVLRRLAVAGVIRLGGAARDPAKAPPPAQVAGKTEYGRFIFPPALMNATCDLSEEERKRIIYFAENLDSWTHYEVLQIDRKADTRAIKRAYFLRSKEWHPDRYRRPHLGPFEPMLRRIFQDIQTAYRVLCDARLRAAYDEQHVPDTGEEEMAERLATQRRKERDARRTVEAAERRKKRNPIRKRMDKARGYYRDAVAAREEGQLLEALRLAQMAQTFDNQPEHSALVEELKAEAGELRVTPYLKRGQAQESLTNWDEAIRFFSEAVHIAPRNGAARIRLAYNLLMGRRPPSHAEEHAHRGVQLLPEDPEAHFVLGMCYERKEMAKAAARSYARAVELKSNYADAKKRLRALKWGF